MSQLNNEEKKNITDEILAKATEEKQEEITEINMERTVKEELEDNKKESKEKMNINMVKNKGSKKLIIFLIIFTIVAILITAGLIYLKNNNNNQNNILTDENEVVVEKEEIKLPDESHLAIKSVTELYSENYITIEVKELKYGKSKDENGDEVYKVNISYPQISGLKNKTVQNKINTEIKEKVLSYYDESVLKDKKIESVNIYANCDANYGDIISVGIRKNIYYTEKDADGYTKYDYISDGINFNLATGEEILFEEVFVNTANIDQIIQKYLYNALLEKIKYNTENEEEQEEYIIDYNNADYSDLENEMLKYMKIYRKEGVKSFYLTPKYLYFTIDDLDTEIELEEIMKDIAIYKRFLSKSMLYENINRERRNFYVFTTPMTDYVKEGQYLDNIYIEIHSYMDNEEIKNENEIIDKFYQKYIDIAKKNPDKAYVIQGDIYLSGFEGKKIIYFSNNFSYTTMSKEYYDKNGKNILLELIKAPRVDVDGCRFSEEHNDKNINVNIISEKYYLDNKLNKLNFIEIQKEFGETFSKASKLKDIELPKITYQDNVYTYDYTNLGGDIKVQEVNTENIINKKITGLEKVDSYEQEEFEDAKEEVRIYLKEELNIDVTNSLKKLQIKKYSDVDSYDYLGGNYILKGEGYDEESLRIAIFKYIMTQANASNDSIFIDSNGREQNKVIKQTLAEQLTKHCCISYEEEDIKASDKPLLITKLLLTIYGEDLLRDALTGRKSIIEQDIKELLDETTYDGCVYALDNYYLGNSLEQEYINIYLTMLNKLQIYKEISYNVFN